MPRKKIKLPIAVLQVANAEGNMVFVEKRSGGGISSGVEGQVHVALGGVDDVGIMAGLDVDHGCNKGVDKDVIQCEVIAGCREIVQTDGDEVLSQAAGDDGSSVQDIRCSTRLVEVSEDIACSKNHVEDTDNVEKND